MIPTPEPEPTPGREPLHLHRWTDLAVVGTAVAALAAGFGQYGAVAALGDVAKAFGHTGHGATIAEQAGLSGTELGIGLAIIRLASLGGLPLAAMADRVGRRTTIFATAALGLAFTIAAALSPGYWWFVAIFAAGRPLLGATNAVAQVIAAEQTSSRDRARAVALVAAGYAVGAGITAVIHSLARSTFGFRGIFALAIVPLAFLPVAHRWVTEPDRFTVAALAKEHPTPVLGAIEAPYGRRLLVVATIAFAVGVITGPATSFTFIYGQNVLHLPGWVLAVMVVASGLFGLLGLLAGRWAADTVGRRPTVAAAIVAIALSGLLAYSGSGAALVVGYILGVVSGALLAPGAGALVNELFPTSVRASAAGWYVAAGVLGAVAGLLVFGAVADIGNRFAVAAAVTFLPAILFNFLFLLLPETRGRELEELWPDT